MEPKLRSFPVKPVIVLACLLGLAAVASAHAQPVHHDLSVTLYPALQRLTGTDRLKLRADAQKELVLTLTDDALVTGAAVEDKSVAFRFKDGRLRIPVSGHGSTNEVTITISYEAFFRDAVPENPVYTEDPSYGVTGTISPEGTFLLSGAHWYPDLPGGKSTFRLRVQAPAGYEAVTAGKRLERGTNEGITVSTWETTHPLQGLALSAGPYVVGEKQHQEIPVYTYFFPEDVHLSEQYRASTAQYLSLYTDLLGPYPFPKYAVVENFFPTGYGFPSYTLIGRRVIRLPFILETSLAHEVAHAWWGTSVFVDPEQGNWCEGLVTYLADHLLKERSSPEEGRTYRLNILRTYATTVSPETDLPLGMFTSRYSPATHAVGYGKGAMVFHMARRRVGEKAFWAGLRQVYRKKLFKAASWDDFASALQETGGLDLGSFFEQWISRPGAPRLSLERVRAKKDNEGWTVAGRLMQEAPYYDLLIPLKMETQGSEVEATISLNGGSVPFTLRSRDRPRSIVVDPDVDVFRHLHPEEIPPVINNLKGSKSLVALAARKAPPEIIASGKILLEGLGHKRAPVLSEAETSLEQIKSHDVLYLGLPERKILLPSLPDALSLSPKAFTLEGKTYQDPRDVFFVVLPHPQDPRRVAGLFLPLAGKQIEREPLKIPHYGKYSYLVFRDGNNEVKGTWPALRSPLIHTFIWKEKPQ
jgi:aminopeptidase N